MSVMAGKAAVVAGYGDGEKVLPSRCVEPVHGLLIAEIDLIWHCKAAMDGYEVKKMIDGLKADIVVTATGNRISSPANISTVKPNAIVWISDTSTTRSTWPGWC